MASEVAENARLRVEVTGLKDTVAARDAALAAKDELISARDATIRDLATRLRLTAAELEWLRKRLFGRSTEKVIHGPALFEGLDDPPAPPAAETAPDDEGSALSERETAKAKKEPRTRKALPVHYPRHRVEIPLPEEQWNCCACGAHRVRIGEEVTEILHRRPAYEVEEQVRGKYACRCGEGGVVIADLPARPIPGSYAGPSLLSFVLTSKYADHLPLYRLTGIFKRDGLDIARSTLCDWVAGVMPLLVPIAQAIRTQVLALTYVQADEIPVTVAEGPSGHAKTAYLWGYRAASSASHEVFFDFRMGRSAEGPREVLADFRGTLQTDAYAGYDAVTRERQLVRAGCLAHARRKFYDALETAPTEVGLVIVVIRRLYAIEDVARTKRMSADERLVLRTEKSLPVLDELHQLVTGLAASATPSSQLGRACAYMLAEWRRLIVFAADGRVEIDNNRMENALRGVAVGRKNWMFCGTEEGGRRAAVLYTIIESCKAVGADPQAYLTDLLTRLPTARESQIPDFLPAAWAAARATQQSPDPGAPPDPPGPLSPPGRDVTGTVASLPTEPPRSLPAIPPGSTTQFADA